MTSDDVPIASDDLDGVRRALGQRMRALRAERGLSVRKLAEAASVTPGFLSQVENGHVMPSVATLIRLTGALGARVGEVFEAVDPSARVVRAGDRTVYPFSEHGVRDEVLSADPSGQVEVLLSHLAAGSGTGAELYTHGTQVEVVHVLDGTVTVSLSDETISLGPGDSLTFSGSNPHGVRNDGAQEARLVWIAAPARY